MSYYRIDLVFRLIVAACRMNFVLNVGRRLLSKMRQCSRLRLLYGLCFLLLFIFICTPRRVAGGAGAYPSMHWARGRNTPWTGFQGKCHLPPSPKLKPVNHVDDSLDLGSRTDVKTCTTWGAPIMWDGMFDPDVYDKHHIKMGASVALTVFAIGRYLETYLMDFLSSADRHFMVGLPVTYYVFTDAPENVTGVNLKAGRTLETIMVKRHKRWQDISMMRMETIADAIQTRVRHRHRYVFCMDVDQVFVGRFGSEALGDSVALLHSSFYNTPQETYTYDRQPNSTAYMETGDFYYHAAVFGGTWQSVRNLTESCLRGIMTDKRNGVEALWHDESHLNKYFWLHKPSKVLSPEYCWNFLNGPSREIHVKRLLWAEKHYDILRS